MILEAIVAVMILLVAYAYSQLRYNEGCLDGFVAAEKICRKYHGEGKEDGE